MGYTHELKLLFLVNLTGNTIQPPYATIQASFDNHLVHPNLPSETQHAE